MEKSILLRAEKIIKKISNLKQISFIIMFSLLTYTAISQNDINTQLLDAVKKPDIEQLKKLVEQGADVNSIDENKATVVMWAAYKGNPDILKYLVSKGADVNKKGIINQGSGATYGSALIAAAGEGKTDVVKYLIEECKIPVDDTEINRTGEPGWTALQAASYFGNLETVKYLIGKGANVNAVCKDDGGSALSYAMQNGKRDVVKYLIDNNADLKITNKSISLDNIFKGIGKGKKKNEEKIYWSGFGIGINGYMNSKQGYSMPSGYDFLKLNYIKSTNVNINLFDEHLTLVKNYINLVTGLGLEVDNYRFKENTLLNQNVNPISATYVKTDSINYKKNKLSDTWVNVPLLLQFNSPKINKNHSFHLSAGIEGGIRINSHTKEVYEVNNTTYKPKTHDDFDQPLLRCSAMVRIGYGWLDLYATYDFNSMFISGQGPDLNPFSVGLTLVHF